MTNKMYITLYQYNIQQLNKTLYPIIHIGPYFADGLITPILARNIHPITDTLY